uniref:Putative RNA dependent RNA polymerase n=1 Tax=Oidiodendron maius splipalmivirus 1 TaxID=2769353 RepID=A0A7G9U7U8_9VIRU|nr:putative RNA dependent RNA polymerase [Oidiodendron maius splipalmivirus 1]
MSLNTAFDSVSSQSESILSLTSHGGREFSASISKYVIHTHTVPLATTIDQQFILGDESTSVFHGYEAGEKSDLHCSLRSCMFIKQATKSRVQEKLKTNCPCHKVREENGSLKPLCFLVYVRALNHNLSGLKNPDAEYTTLDPNEVMFCQSATGCFDNSYPGPLRDRVKVTGWHHVTDKSIFPLMDCLYWFRKYKKQYKLEQQMREFLQRAGLRQLKHIVTQCCHSINSLLVKKMMAMSPEIEGYAQIAKHTAWAFSELFKDYSAACAFTEGGVMVEPKSGFYLDCKDFSALVKSSFHRQKRSDRMSWLEPKASTKAFLAFFGTELKRLKAYIEQQYASEQSDYTLSPAWIFRASTLSQTRGMGYLPNAVAECRRTVFRLTVNRELIDYPARLTRLQYLAVQKRLQEGGVAAKFLSEGRMGKYRDEETRLLFEDVFSRIEMVLKGTASVDTFVKDGGKLEDARLLLNLAIRHKWKIPIRNLEDHSIEGFVEVVRETDSETDYSRPLFWLSYQLILNHWVNREEWPKTDEHLFMVNGEPYRPPVMDAQIVHISEPGKERNLTKSHAVLAWFLTPASKITQGTLAHLPEHRAGLLESGHEWRHQKRISALSDESGFIYDPSTGKTRWEVRQVFKDWTESTDFICKAVGWAHLKALLDYIGFPSMYGRLVLKTIVEPQPVVEVTHRIQVEGGEDIVEPVEWHGSINEGFMMGNPMTKTILHLVHTSELMVAKEFLRRRGLRFREPMKLARFPDQAQLDREESQRDRTTIVTL